MTIFNEYADYYDTLYRDKDYAKECGYVDRLIRRFSPGAASLLDMGCGTGRYSSLFAERGYAVTGIDLSEKMIAHARNSVPAGATASDFHLGDIRSFRSGRTFDAVVSLFHVFSYQTSNADLAQAFATARCHLAPGGIFVFDCWYGPAVLTDRPRTTVKRVTTEAFQLVRIAEPAMAADDNLVEVNYELVVCGSATGAVTRLSETHRMRYLFGPEIHGFLAAAGFRLLAAEEWLTGGELNFGTWNACYVAQAIGDTA